MDNVLGYVSLDFIISIAYLHGINICKCCGFFGSVPLLISASIVFVILALAYALYNKPDLNLITTHAYQFHSSVFYCNMKQSRKKNLKRAYHGKKSVPHIYTFMNDILVYIFCFFQHVLVIIAHKRPKSRNKRKKNFKAFYYNMLPQYTLARVYYEISCVFILFSQFNAI